MTERSRRIFTIGLYALLPVAALLFYGQAAIEPFTYVTSGTCPGADCVQTITMVKPAVLTALQAAAAIVALILLIAGITAIRRRAHLQSVLLLVFALGMYPISCLGADGWFRLESWAYVYESGAAKDKRYVLLQLRWLDPILYISEPWKSGTWTRSTKVLAVGSLDTEGTGVPIVRSVGQKQSDHLRLIRCGSTLLAIAKNRVSVAYDTASRKEYGDEQIHSLSPFVCLKPGDSLHPGDRAAFQKWVQEECKFGGVSQQTREMIKTLIRATKQPNTAARALARTMLRCLQTKVENENKWSGN